MGGAVVSASIVAEANGLRPHGSSFTGSWSEGPWVVRIDPADGAGGVLADAPVVVTLSHPADAATLSARTVRVREGALPLPGHLALSPDGCVVIWIPELPLQAGVEHVLEVSGLCDRRGREVRPHRSLFTVGHHSLEDLMEDKAG
jgi:hypothetical protein